MSPAGPSKSAEAWGRPAIIVLATALVVLLDLAFGTVAYNPLFYLVLIIAAFWYRRRAVIVGILLALAHVAVGSILYGTPDAAILVNAAAFVVAAYLLGYLFEIAGRRAGGLHFHIGDGGGAACDRDTRRLIARLSSRDPETRYQAAGCLGDAGNPAAVEPLAALLDDPEVGVRWKATESLGRMGPPAVGPLTASLKSENVDVRWMAAVALSDIGDPAAIPALMGALDDPDAYVWSRAALALGAIGEPAQKEVVAGLSGGNERVRRGAAVALGIIGGESSIAALVEALRDPDREVRQRAGTALGDIGEPAVPLLIEALGTENELLRRSAAASLGLIGKPAVPALAMALRPGGDPRASVGAAHALGEIGGRMSTDILIRALEDEREEVREAAREALGSIRKT